MEETHERVVKWLTVGIATGIAYCILFPKAPGDSQEGDAPPEDGTQEDGPKQEGAKEEANAEGGAAGEEGAEAAGGGGEAEVAPVVSFGTISRYRMSNVYDIDMAKRSLVPMTSRRPLAAAAGDWDRSGAPGAVHTASPPSGSRLRALGRGPAKPVRRTDSRMNHRLWCALPSLQPDTPVIHSEATWVVARAGKPAVRARASNMGSAATLRSHSRGEGDSPSAARKRRKAESIGSLPENNKEMVCSGKSRDLCSSYLTDFAPPRHLTHVTVAMALRQRRESGQGGDVATIPYSASGGLARTKVKTRVERADGRFGDSKFDYKKRAEIRGLKGRSSESLNRDDTRQNAESLPAVAKKGRLDGDDKKLDGDAGGDRRRDEPRNTGARRPANPQGDEPMDEGEGEGGEPAAEASGGGAESGAETGAESGAEGAEDTEGEATQGEECDEECSGAEGGGGGGPVFDPLGISGAMIYLTHLHPTVKYMLVMCVGVLMNRILE